MTAGGLPLAEALLQQPHAIDILQKSYPASDSAFVSEVFAPRGSRRARCVQLRAYQGPRAGANEGPVAVRVRNAGDGGSRIVTGRGDHSCPLARGKGRETVSNESQLRSRGDNARRGGLVKADFL